MAFRRSIYAAQDIAAGEVFTEANLRIVRPGHGAPPWLLDHLLGAKARQDFPAGTALSLDQLFKDYFREEGVRSERPATV